MLEELQNKDKISGIKVYQDLTFEVLDKLIKGECSKGNSKLSLNSSYKFGMQMKSYLEELGFKIYYGFGGEFIITW